MRPLPLRQAIALGVAHGPSELLPISSSGHTGAIPWLLGWSYARLDPGTRKSFEVALHTGTTAALLTRMPLHLGRRDLTFLALTALPGALAGLALERPIERLLGTPPTTAAGLVAGSVLMVVADRAPQARPYREAGSSEAMWLGLAQATALVPGVSRSAATLSAARLLGFRRADAARLSQKASLPVVAGAAVLKLIRVWQRRLPKELAAPFAAGAAAAFVATLVCDGLLRPLWRGPMWPFAAYRTALASAIVWRLRDTSRSGSTALHRAAARL